LKGSKVSSIIEQPKPELISKDSENFLKESEDRDMVKPATNCLGRCGRGEVAVVLAAPGAGGVAPQMF